jgi:N-acetylglutamate synthase-like GNAT family acetyltransferase
VPRLTFRTAEISDIDAIVRLVNRAFVAESPFVEGERINPDTVREMWPRGTFLLGEDHGQILACIFIEPRAAQAHLGLVSVEPARQGEGLGRELMAAAEARCRAAGFREMELRFIDQRAELERFYQRMGFARTGITEPPPPARAKVPFHFVQLIKSVV